MPTVTQITVTQPDMNRARCQALFSSGLQPSDAPSADMIATAISRTVQQFGLGGCAGRMAQEFGDNPDAAARRMRWVRQLVTQPAALWLNGHILATREGYFHYCVSLTLL
jgi:hypothetical protein